MMLTLLPDLNVAALKYAHVHREHGGPIHSLSFIERDLPEGKYFEAYARLDELKTGLRNLGDQPQGHTLAPTKSDAVHMAISHAIETWAWLVTKKDPHLSSSLRMDIDATLAGFAAFPGLGVQGAKKRAYFEAAEKWTLCAWWEGKLPHSSLPNANGIQIVPPIPGVTVVVLWAVANERTFYGIGTSFNAAAAGARARISLQRNRDRLENLTETPSPALRRLKYFAGPDGAGAFCNRLELKGLRSEAPALIVDLAVLGPWHQYAHVWRCLFESAGFHEKDKDDYFYF